MPQGLLGEMKAAEQGLEARIGPKSVPIASDGEMKAGSLAGVDGFFEPSEGEIVLPGVGIEACDAHAGDVGVLRTCGEDVAGTFHGFAVAAGGEAGVERVNCRLISQ